jgi:hypothetical protein
MMMMMMMMGRRGGGEELDRDDMTAAVAMIWLPLRGIQT